MAVDAKDFLAAYPDFEPASPHMIDTALGYAVDNIDPTVFDDKTDQAVGLYAADWLAMQPFGKQARLQSKEGDTVYGKLLDRLTRSVTPGFRVA